MTPEIQKNVKFIQSLFDHGYDQVPLNAIPHPGKLIYCRKHCPILSITSTTVLIHTNDTPIKSDKSVTQLLNEATGKVR
jgi:hypothetical protein